MYLTLKLEQREKCECHYYSNISHLSIIAKSEASSSSAATANQAQTKPALPTPIPEDANAGGSAFQQSKGDTTTTSSINPSMFAITGSRSSSVSEQPKEGKIVTS